MTPAKSSDSLSLWQRLKRVAPWFAGHSGTYALAVLGVLIGSATEPAIPALMKPLLDSGFQQGSLVLWHIPVVLVLLFGVRGLAGFIAAYCLARVANASMAGLRQHLFEKLLRVDPSLFQDQHASSLTNSMVYEVNSGANLLVSTLLSLAKDFFTLVALLGYLFILNWQLTLIVFAVFPPIAWVVKTVTRRLQQVIRESQAATETLAYVVEENVLAYRMVRLHNAQPDQSHKFSKVNERLRQLAIKSVVANSLMTPLTQLLAAMALSAVITVAIVQSNQSHQTVTVGGFAAFITAMLMLISPIKHLSEVIGSVTRGLTAIERGLDVLDAAPDEAQGTHTATSVRGAVEFQNVALTYPSGTAPALAGVSLSIQAGQTVALVGASGSGKTTLANVLPRFIKPTSGQVLLDGVPLQDWQLTNLRSHMAYVSQDV
ncbi:MAG: ABC transporter transmembrane domain-containing protein, partial [Limnohabitans sp.]